MATFAVYAAAAIAEIAGCFAVWTWARAGGSSLWLVPGLACLALFAYLLTLVDAAAAGRAFAAYGGVSIVASLAWMWRVERVPPDGCDVAGAELCLVRATIVIAAPRGLA
jgi:small multidrug resistance family-3 protein